VRSRAGYKSGVFQVLTRSDVREILVLNREHLPGPQTILYAIWTAKLVLVHPE